MNYFFINNKKIFLFFCDHKILARGVEYLFPVQYRSYNEIISGKDCIVQARKIFKKKLFCHRKFN